MDKLKQVREAAGRIQKYLDELAKVRGIDQNEIAHLHTGDEREAFVTASDLRLILASLDAVASDAPADHIRDAAKMIEPAEGAEPNIKLELQNIRSILDDTHVDYHEQGMGCGLEDRGITDRYDAARYGFDEAIDRMHDEVIKYAIAAIDELLASLSQPAKSKPAQAQVVPEASEWLESKMSVASWDWRKGWNACREYVFAAPALPQQGERDATPIDFSKPLETMAGEPVKYICSDVIEYKCARVCVEQETGTVYSGPYFGMKIRNAAPPSNQPEQLSDEEILAKARERFGWASGLGGFDAAVLDFARSLLSSRKESKPTVPEWISVKDRLPEEEQYVFMCGKNPPDAPRPFWRDCGIYRDGVFYDKNMCTQSCVTNWMPLPAAPSLDGGEG